MQPAEQQQGRKGDTFKKLHKAVDGGLLPTRQLPRPHLNPIPSFYLARALGQAQCAHRCGCARHFQ